MPDTDIIKTFESVGIPKMQTLVYLDLLKNRESTATEVSKRTRIKITRHYRFLEGSSENEEDSSKASPGETASVKS